MLFSTALAAGLALVSSAETYTWTGLGGDGKWVNAANWNPTGIPGCYYDEGGDVQAVTSQDVAIFGADASGAAAVTIDLERQRYVYQVVITNGAPSYTFGTAASYAQSLGIGTNGSVRIAKGVDKDQHFPYLRINPNDASGTAATTFWNDSSEAVFNYGDVNSIVGSGKGGYPYARLTLSGSGAFEMQGGCKFDQCGTLNIQTTGKVSWSDSSSTGARYSAMYVKSNNGALHEIELPTPTSAIRGNGGSFPWSNLIQFEENTRVYGPGKIEIPVPYNMPVDCEQPTRLQVSENKTATIDCCIARCPNWNAKDLVLYANGAKGSFCLNGTNSLTGSLRIYGAYTIVGVRLLGNKGCSAAESSVPLGETIVYEGEWTATTEKVDGKTRLKTFTPKGRPGGTLKFTGAAGSSTDRTLMISNTYATVKPELLPTNTFANAGAGAFTLNSLIVQSPESSGASFRLKAETAPLAFGGTFAVDEGHDWNVLIDGPDAVRITATQAYAGFTSLDGGTLELSSLDVLPNTSGFLINGGSLKLTESAGEARPPIRVVKSGALSLPADAGVLSLDIECAAGTGLAFAIPSGTTLKVPKFAEGPLDANFSVNGNAAKVSEDGVVSEAVARWAAATDGNWTETAKWTPSAPLTTDTVYIDVAGEDGYAVSVTDRSADGMSDIRVANGAELKFGTDYTFQDQALTVGDGGTVSAGGGSKLTFAGGTRGPVDLQTNGTIAIYANATGVVAGADSACIDHRGGTLDVAGVLEPFTDSEKRCHLRDGETIVRDGGVFGNAVKNPFLYVAPHAAGGEAKLTLEKGGKFGNNQGNVYVGYNVAGGRSIMRIDGKSVTEKVYVSSNPYGFGVGVKKGYGELDIVGGKLDIGNYGFFIGCEEFESTEIGTSGASCPTGVVNITAGDVTVNGYGWHYANYPCGLMVGNGLSLSKDAATRAASRYTGSLTLSGGSLKTSVGATVIGGGPADGELTVCGGTFSHVGYNTYNELIAKCRLVVGMLGGTGRFTVSSGKASVQYVAFVGGAPLAELQHTGLIASYLPTTLQAATGTLTVTGGTFTCTQDPGAVIVGADGTGMLELGGTATFSCKELVLSNNVASVLKFDLPETSTLGWNASCTNLVITDGAKLVVDATGFKGRRFPMRKLLSVNGTVTGAFDASQVEFRCPEGMDDLFDHATVLIEYKGQKGVWVKGRPAGIVLIFR